MHTKDNCGWLDKFRLIAALLVVAIHTSPLGAFSPEGDFFFTRVLARIAVPFFFMVTGQFVVGKFIDEDDLPLSPEGLSDTGTVEHTKENGAGQNNPWGYLKKILFLYAAAIVLYLPVGIYAGHYKGLTPLSALRMLLFDGTFYHLWYFPACLLGVLTVYLMSRFLRLRGILAVSGVLYAMGLLGDSYFGLAQKLPVVEGAYEFFFQICSYTRNGLFFAPLFLTLGAWCAKASRRGLPVHLTAFLVSFLLMTAEAFTLRSISWQRHDSMYLLLVPVMIFLYRTLLCLSQLSGKPRKRFRSASLWIYLLHPAFIIVVRGIAKVLHLTPLLVDNSLVHYLAVSLLSTAAGFGMTFLPVGKVLAFFRHTSRSRQTRHRTDSSETARPNTAIHFSETTRLKCHLSGKLSSPRHTPSPAGRAWIELDTSALAQNVEYLHSLLPEGCRLMPAVKANAYGHGSDLIAGELNRLGVDAFCVACLSEGISLREANIKGEILILGYTPPEDFPLLARYRLTQTVIDYAYAGQLSEAGIMIHVHIGIDTGMHRIGIRCENIEEILAVFEIKNLIIDGMFTHLCTCDSPLPEDKAFTESQIQAFYHVADILEEQGIPCPRLHLQSSYGLLNYPGLPADYVRAGIALYGVASTVEDRLFFRENLIPVLSLKARVASVRTLYAGDSVGYGLAFTAKKDMDIAVLSIGYADGLPRELSCGIGSVLIHGRKAPIIGRICMDQTLVDISGIPQTCTGDTAVLIGVSGEEEITAEELAFQCGTITNELLSRLGGRLERIILSSL